jgi:hypothetical protein
VIRGHQDLRRSLTWLSSLLAYANRYSPQPAPPGLTLRFTP